MHEIIERSNLIVANHYFHDATDHLLRFRVTRDQFSTVRWRRIKCFADLRMAYECALKSAVAYFSPPTPTQDLINSIEKFGHRIARLQSSVLEQASGLRVPVEFGEVLDSLPVTLRYRAESDSLTSGDDRLYYNTIGRESWLNSLEAGVAALTEAIDVRLRSQSQVVPAIDLVEEVLDWPSTPRGAA